jgi:hypothetical protein
MATKKKEVKVRDLKPSKDAKGGVARQGATQQGATRQGATRQGATRGHQ